jgi:hypothetical protein
VGGLVGQSPFHQELAKVGSSLVKLVSLVYNFELVSLEVSIVMLSYPVRLSCDLVRIPVSSCMQSSYGHPSVLLAAQGLPHSM